MRQVFGLFVKIFAASNVIHDFGICCFVGSHKLFVGQKKFSPDTTRGQNIFLTAEIKQDCRKAGINFTAGKKNFPPTQRGDNMIHESAQEVQEARLHQTRNHSKISLIHVVRYHQLRNCVGRIYLHKVVVLLRHDCVLRNKTVIVVLVARP